MAHILISFLGKSSKQENGQYRQANYCFDNGSQETGRFFSFALNIKIAPVCNWLKTSANAALRDFRVAATVLPYKLTFTNIGSKANADYFVIPFVHCVASSSSQAGAWELAQLHRARLFRRRFGG